jgi:hypothetical protein
MIQCPVHFIATNKIKTRRLYLEMMHPRFKASCINSTISSVRENHMYNKMKLLRIQICHRQDILSYQTVIPANDLVVFHLCKENT